MSTKPLLAIEPLPEPDDNLGSMTFRQALATFLETRKPFLHPRTVTDYKYCSEHLGNFFGHLRPGEITAMHIRRYQVQRRETCGPHMINHETSLLQQLLKRCGTWERIGLGFQPLPLPKDSPGRAISDDEEHRLLRACTVNPRWVDVYLFALLSLNTTMGPGEVTALRRRDVDLERKTVTVTSEGAKNHYRIRTIPLNDIALKQSKKRSAWLRRKVRSSLITRIPVSAEKQAI